MHLCGRIAECRRVIARQGGPAFTVFNDATLKATARARPDSLRAFASIKGVGPTFGPPKSNAAYRTVTVPPTITALLAEHRITAAPWSTMLLEFISFG